MIVRALAGTKIAACFALVLAVNAPASLGGPATEAGGDALAPWLPAARSAIDPEMRWRRALGRLEPTTRIVFIGDSIFENWLTIGRDSWTTTFVPRGAADLGVGGDRTENTLWRIAHGELDRIEPRVAVILIGTNDLDRWRPDETARGVVAVVAAVRAKLPESRIVLLAILPRDATPIAPLRARARTVNSILRATAFGPNVTYRDIGAAFLNSDGTLVRSAFEDGRLHPNAEGYERFAQALEAFVHS